MDWPSGSHASTFGGNPVCCRAALVTLDLLEREYLANAAQRGDQLLAGLRRIGASGSRFGRPARARADGRCRCDECGRTPTRNAARPSSKPRSIAACCCWDAAKRACASVRRLCVTAEQVESALSIFAETCGDVVAN